MLGGAADGEAAQRCCVLSSSTDRGRPSGPPRRPDQQRQLIAHGDWVAEGRDIGTVVAPGAAVKVFLTADPRERARRRARELGATAGLVLAEQAMRDQRDSTREHSPLHAAPDAITLDTTGLDLEEVRAADHRARATSYSLRPALFAVGPASVAPPRRLRRRAAPQPGRG